MARIVRLKRVKTVGQLIKTLSSYPPDMEMSDPMYVYRLHPMTENERDLYGKAGVVRVEENDGSLD